MRRSVRRRLFDEDANDEDEVGGGDGGGDESDYFVADGEVEV